MRSIRTSLCLLSCAVTLGACDVNLPVALRVKEKVDATQVTLAQAIDAARAALPAGVVVDAELTLEDQRTVYEVGLFADGALNKVEIDPATGAVLRSETDRDADDVADAEAAAAAVAGAAVDAKTAIATAEAELAGALAFEFEVTPGGAYEVEVVAEDALLEIRLSPATGEVLAVDVSDDRHGGRDDDDDHGGDVERDDD